MGLGIQMTLGQDTATPAVQRLLTGLRPEQLKPIVGRSAANSYKAYLTGLNAQRPNQLGGPRTNFYLSAAKGVSFQVAGDFVVVSIPSVGLAQRYFGGVIKAKKKYLTIPAVPEAHGKRASEFSDLHFAFETNPSTGHVQAALVQGERSLIHTRRSKNGVKAFFAGDQERRVVFWLARQVTQKADPSVLPYPEQVTTKAIEDAASYAKLIWDRANPAGGAN